MRDLLEQIYEAVEGGGDACRWLGHAYISWYRGLDQVSLKGVENLDSDNLKLFLSMLQLRRQHGWRDAELYEFEQRIKKLISPVGQA